MWLRLLVWLPAALVSLPVRDLLNLTQVGPRASTRPASLLTLLFVIAAVAPGLRRPRYEGPLALGTEASLTADESGIGSRHARHRRLRAKHDMHRRTPPAEQVALALLV